MPGTEQYRLSAPTQAGKIYGIAHPKKHGICAAIRFAEISRIDKAHAHRVARIAIRIFDDLQPVHGLNRAARSWLLCAAILHDIAKGSEAQHHKAAFRIVLNTPHLPFNLWTRRVVGLTARYHRKASPSAKHAHFRALNAEDREIVRKLAAILRLADALDAGHRGLVRRMRCKIQPNHIVSHCTLARHSQPEDRRRLKKMALEKGLLFRKVFGCRLSIKWSAV